MLCRRQLLRLRSWTIQVTAVLLTAAITFGCSEDDPTEPEPSVEKTHQLPANGNDMIIVETVGSSGDPNASIWEILEKSTGGYYFRGFHRGHYVIGTLDADGRIEWSRRTFYRTGGFGLTPNDIPDLAGMVFVAGSQDSDDDGWLDTGLFSIFDENGNLIDELTWDDPDYDIRFEDVIYNGTDAGAMRFLVVGREYGNDSVYHPLAATITLSADSTLQAGTRYKYSGTSNMYFWEVIENPAAGNDGYFMTGGVYNPDRSLNHSVVFLADANLDIQWQEEIVTGPGLVTNLHLGYQAAATVDAIYCMGYTDVNRTSSSGQYWDGGLLASISTQGQVNWVRTYDASNWSDRFYDCQLVGGVLYIAGIFAAYTDKDTEQTFGYGWLAKADPQTGDILSSNTLGSNRWFSRFNCLDVSGQDAWAAGYTQWKNKNSTFNYWSVNVDISGMTVSQTAGSFSRSAAITANASERPPAVIEGHRGGENKVGFSD